MNGLRTWNDIRDERLASPEAKAGYEAARSAYEFGRRVRERREAHGLSQAELAAAIGTSQPAIARLEAGGTEPTLRTMCSLSKALGADWVIGFDGIRSESSGVAPATAS